MTDSRVASDREAWIDRLRVLAALAVVCIHVGVFAGIAVEPRGTVAWWFATVVCSCVRWCVPVWVMISGAVLLSGNRQWGPGEFYRARLPKILVPWLGWSLFYSVWTFLRLYLKGQPLPWLHQLAISLDGRAYYQLWFLLPLLLLYLATPFLRGVVRQATSFQVAVLAGSIWLYFLVGFVHGLIHHRGSGINAEGVVPFASLYLTGYLLRNLTIAGNRTLFVGIILAFTALGALFWGQAKTEFWQQFFTSGMGPLNLLVSISLFLLIRNFGSGPLSRWEADFAKSSFGVYLVHPLILDVLVFGTNKLHLNAFANIPILFVGVALLSWLVARTLARIPFLCRFV